MIEIIFTIFTTIHLQQLRADKFSSFFKSQAFTFSSAS